MNRRKFLGASVGAAAILTGTTREIAGRRESIANESAGDVIGRLAGRSLKELRDLYRRDLFDDFLPFMDRYVIDHKMGGFMCNTDFDGTNFNRNKSSWFEGRGAWVYAFLYNNLAREEKYLNVARKSVELLLKIKPSGEDQLWPADLTREGKPLRASPENEVYGDLFIAEGFAEYSKATNDRAYWEMAKRIVDKCLRIYDRPDYRPSIGQTYLGPEARPFPGARIQGVWMVLIRLVTQMLRMHPDPELEKIAARSVDAVMNYHFNPAFDLNNELLNHDLSRPTNQYAELVYTGHSLEISWMILFEAARIRDEKLFNTEVERFKRHAGVAWDDVYGGVFRNLQNVDQNVWSLDKVLWAQEEVLIAALFIIEHTGVGWAKELFDKMYSYVRAKFPLKDHGSPLWMYASDRRATFEAFAKMPKRVENYHHPRHLMLNLLSLERIIKRGGKTSRLFA
jgi:mannose/cellobiose epimerase-like protein (N-acyl-D-glucosamine 2-epimerase family)